MRVSEQFINEMPLYRRSTELAKKLIGLRNQKTQILKTSKLSDVSIKQRLSNLNKQISKLVDELKRAKNTEFNLIGA